MMKSIKTVYKIPVYVISFFIMISAVGCSSTGKVSVMPAMKIKIDNTPKEYDVVAAETRTLEEFLEVDALVCYGVSEELFFHINDCNLKAIYVEEDDKVEKGQLLAELDASNLESQLAEKQIALEKVKLKYGSIINESGTEAADRNTELENLHLDMESKELDITHLKDLISKTQLVAPFSGPITDIVHVKPGIKIQAYEKLMTIWKSDSIIAKSVILNPYDSSGSINLSNLVKGMKVELIHGSKDTRTVIPATISEIINTDPGVEENPNRILAEPPPFRLLIKPDGENADLLVIDRTVILKINTGTLENAVVLPKDTIKGTGNVQLLKVVKGDKIITRKVTTGYVDNEENIIVITSGLLPGESVVRKEH